MSGVVSAACLVAAVVCAGISAGLAARLQFIRLQRQRRRGKGLSGSVRKFSSTGASMQSDWVLRYAERLTKRLFAGETNPFSPSVRAKHAGNTHAGARYRELSVVAGCSKEITVAAFCEARTRLGLAGALVGAAFGCLFSLEMALLLALALGLVGHALPLRSVRLAGKRRAVEAERHLSEMLDVVALGLRSGLTFDRSFALYGSHFDNGFARSCTKAYRRWALGLSTREESLRDLAASYDCEQLSRVVDSVVRSLRFGSALADILEDSAVQSRESYRTALEERVAKAPVKMMLPTGTLILPAMLLLVLGPVLLELASGF